MSFEVVVEELGSAARAVESAVSPRACYHLPLTGVDAASFGHVELAEWMVTVGQDADTTLRELAARGEQVAAALRGSATTYVAADTRAQHSFGGPVPTP